MRTRWLWGAAACAWALVGSGCSEVESCAEGEPGCLNGTTQNGSCRFGLVPSRGPNPTCVEAGDDDDDDSANCGCPTGALCNGQKQCIDACGTSDLPVHTPVPAPCRAAEGQSPYDFATAAQALCSQRCIRQNEYCPSSPCDPSVDCSGAATAPALLVACPGMSPECAMTRCEQIRDQPCAEFQCGGDASPNCTGVVCSDSCVSRDESYIRDGFCDDGDLSNAISSFCVWGSDCGDCGPRRGARPPDFISLGEPCVDPAQCGGNQFDIAGSTAWCVTLDDALNILRCVPDCSQSAACPNGFVCQELVYTLNGEPMPIKDDTGLTARACLPIQCGGGG